MLERWLALGSAVKHQAALLAVVAGRPLASRPAEPQRQESALALSPQSVTGRNSRTQNMGRRLAGWPLSRFYRTLECVDSTANRHQRHNPLMKVDSNFHHADLTAGCRSQLTPRYKYGFHYINGRHQNNTSLIRRVQFSPISTTPLRKKIQLWENFGACCRRPTTTTIFLPNLTLPNGQKAKRPPKGGKKERKKERKLKGNNTHYTTTTTTTRSMGRTTSKGPFSFCHQQQLDISRTKKVTSFSSSWDLEKKKSLFLANSNLMTPEQKKKESEAGVFFIFLPLHSPSKPLWSPRTTCLADKTNHPVKRAESQ